MLTLIAGGSARTFLTTLPDLLITVMVSPTPMVVPNNILTYSGSGDVTATVSIPAGDHRGCNASDFAGFPAGHIALVQRGAPDGFPVACTFAMKVTKFEMPTISTPQRMRSG